MIRSLAAVAARLFRASAGNGFPEIVVRHTALIVLCFAFHQSLGAQMSADPVARHRALYQAIETNKARYRTAQATREELGLEDQSVEGGWVRAYCDGNEIKLLFIEDDGETGTGQRSFYFDHDSLFFVYRHDGRGHMSATSGPYPKRTEFDDERLYFTDGKLVRWLGNKNRSLDIASDSATRRARDYLGIYVTSVVEPRT